MQRLTYINLHGDVLTFGASPPYVLESVKGLGRPAAKVSTSQGVYQHGDTPEQALFEPRFVELSFHIDGLSRADMYQRRLALAGLLSAGRTFDGERQGKLFYENDYGTWWAYAMPEEFDANKRAQNFLYSTKLVFRCASPYWRAKTPGLLVLEMKEGGLQFPFQLPFQLGQRGFNGQAVNKGHAAAPLRIEIVGSGETPVLLNKSTGALLVVAAPIAIGETMLIDTDPDVLSVQIRAADGTLRNAHGKLETPLASFVLRPGVNEMAYQPSAPNALSHVALRWDALYEGV